MQQNDLIAPGTVWLVGAGPGDPDLLTRKAERLIAAADMIFYDALVGPAVIELASTVAERISVGKRSGRHSKDQRSINDMLLAAALEGRRVVRLKGGDPSIFGRSNEELDHLMAHGVSVNICPGITTASAAAASSLASLTLRGSVRKLTFVTAHTRADEAIGHDWNALADGKSTLAIYMGRDAAGEISRSLIGAGMSATTPVLIACDVSLATEKLLRTRLDLLPLAISAVAAEAPTLILIGEAVAVRPHQHADRSICDRSDGPPVLRVEPDFR